MYTLPVYDLVNRPAHTDVISKMKQTYYYIIAQIIICLIPLFGDIGFDKGGKYGLDFGHLLLAIAVFTIIVLVHSTRLARKKLWFLFSLQLIGAPCMLLISIIIGDH